MYPQLSNVIDILLRFHMAIPSVKFPGYYHVPRAPSALIDRQGHVILAINGEPCPTWIDEHRGLYRTRITHEGKYFFASLAILIAEIFIPVPKHLENVKRPVVAFLDGVPSNHEIENLYWTSQAEIQQTRWGAIRAKNRELYPLPRFDEKNTGVYPNAIECLYKPGYYYIPLPECHVVISKEGELFHLLNGKEHPTYSNPKGYLLTALTGMRGKYEAFPVHRLVASLFVGRPKRHATMDHKELQVNHIDGVKSNNSHQNLEWITLVENMKHAWATGLVKTEIPVLAKNIVSGEIIRYRSRSACARALCVSASAVSKHLSSPAAGRVVHKSFVYKDDDGSDWPEFVYPARSDINLGVIYGRNAVVAIEVATGSVYLCGSLPKAAHLLGLTPLRVINWRIRKGHHVPCDGYRFLSFTEHLAQLEG